MLKLKEDGYVYISDKGIEIIKKIISRITDNPIKNLSMAISSVTNKYFLNHL